MLARPLRLLVPVVAVVARWCSSSVSASSRSPRAPAAGGGSRRYGACDAGVRAPGGPLAGGRAGTRAGDLSDEQRQNAATIIGVARDMGAPPRAWLVALATAMQESTLRNINYGDRDSLGLFQQRPSQGWGSPAAGHRPGLRHADLHRATAGGARLGASAGHGGRADRAALGVPGRLREVGGAGRRARAAARGRRRPDRLRATRRRCRRAWRARRSSSRSREVGKPYVWGGTGPNTYDCSGLMLRAFQAAGINLPRVSRQQFYAGGHVPVEQAQPGDLLFYATDPSDPRPSTTSCSTWATGRWWRRPTAASRCGCGRSRGTTRSWCRWPRARAPLRTPRSGLDTVALCDQYEQESVSL